MHFDIVPATQCELCEQAEESIEHLFTQCHVSKTTRNFAGAITGINISNTHISLTLDLEQCLNYGGLGPGLLQEITYGP
jgi:hypothetical protein